MSSTVAGSDQTSWLKATLDEIHCIKKVRWYRNTGSPYRSWTCTETDCSNCVGYSCKRYTLTVSIEEAAQDLSPVSDCRYGNTVKLVESNAAIFEVIEMGIVGKEGKISRLIFAFKNCNFIENYNFFQWKRPMMSAFKDVHEKNKNNVRKILKILFLQISIKSYILTKF